MAESASGDPWSAAWLASLATVCVVLFDHGEDAGDLDDAIGTVRRVLGSTPGVGPARAGRASDLASALCARFERAAARDDLTEALAAACEAACVSTSGQVRVARFFPLPTALRVRRSGTTGPSDIRDRGGGRLPGRRPVSDGPAACAGQCLLLGMDRRRVRDRWGSPVTHIPVPGQSINSEEPDQEAWDTSDEWRNILPGI